MTLPTLSLNEQQALIALRSFLIANTSFGNQPIECVRGNQNLVPEPFGSDFIVMWAIHQLRLSTNETTFYDNIVLGSIQNDVLTITQTIRGFVPFGVLVLDINGSLSNITITNQLTANPADPTGVAGTYQLSNSRTLPQEVLYIGFRQDLVPTQLTVQLDIHGPNSADNAKVIEGLFRSDYAVDAIQAINSEVTPLYCDEARFTPFRNAELQIEYMWTLDLNLQINPIIGTPAQFAQTLTPKSLPADLIYSIF